MAQEGGGQGLYPTAHGGHSQQSYVAYPHQPEGVTIQQSVYPPQPQGAYPPQTVPYPAKPDSGYQAPLLYGQPGKAEDDVVTKPPTSQMVMVDKPQSQPGLGICATVIATVSTVFVTGCLCWWALPFTIIGIILGVTAASYGSKGDIKTSRTHFIISICLSITGIILAVIGAVTIIAVVVVRVKAAVREVQRINSL